MFSKEARTRLSRWIARYSLFLCSLIIKFMPQGLLNSFAERIAFLGYFIAAKQRKIALDSLKIAFGRELSDAKRIKIAKDSFRNMAKSGIELLYVLERPSLSRDLVSIRGRQYLDEALSKGNGVIAVSAHFGNFPLALTKLSQDGYKVSVILKRMRDENVEEFLEARRQRVGIHSIHTNPRQACVDGSIRALRNNELLFIQLDQNFGASGVFVDFFGQKAATATGPVVLTLRTQAPIVPMFIVRTRPRHYDILIEPPITMEKKDTFEETLQHNIQKITSIIEAYIRKYPAEWGWIHRRWKSRPAH